MMIHPAFTLDGKAYGKAALVRLCQAQLSDQSLPGYERDLYGFLQSWLDENEEIKVKTSGSTGCPKAISLPKERMIASARLSGEVFGLKAGQTALLCLPVRYIAGKMMVVRAMVWGMHLISVLPKGNPLLNLAVDQQIDFAAMVPAQVFTLLSDTEATSILRDIGTLILGGGEIPAVIEARLRHFPNPVYATYGMTETITHVAVRRINGDQPVEVYRALPGVSFAVDHEGCLIIHAKHLGKEPIVATDVVDLIDEHTFTYKGRIDNVINTGGIKMHPEETERKLSGIIQAQFFITAAQDERLGQKPVLVIEGSEDVDIHALKQQMAQVLSPHELPAEIRLVDEIPLNAGGKMRREM